MVKFPGVAVMFADGVERVVPPLTLRAVTALSERLAAYTGGVGSNDVALVVDTVHAALVRNYPEITRDDVSDLVDLGNMAAVMQATLKVGGFQERQPGEAVAQAVSTG